MARRYGLKERARSQEATRRRIVEATVELHREVGPARTTIAEIARRAGVGRVTVYNHFPDEAALLGACSAQFVTDNPPPDPALGSRSRTRTGVCARRSWSSTATTAPTSDAGQRHPGRSPGARAGRGDGRAGAGEHERAMREVLLAGRVLHGGKGRRTAAAVGLALAFGTWQRLTRDEGLDGRRRREAHGQGDRSALIAGQAAWAGGVAHSSAAGVGGMPWRLKTVPRVTVKRVPAGNAALSTAAASRGPARRRPRPRGGCWGGVAHCPA